MQAVSAGGCGWHTKHSLEEPPLIQGRGDDREELANVRGQGGNREEQPHVQEAVAAQAQEGLEEPSHVEVRKGSGEEICLIQGKEHQQRKPK